MLEELPVQKDSDVTVIGQGGLWRGYLGWQSWKCPDLDDERRPLETEIISIAVNSNVY